MVLKSDERWSYTNKLCNGHANYNGPCGDPYCSDCFPGGLICKQCSELKGACECDNCEICGEDWEKFREEGYCVCPYCHCINCGDSEKNCNCPDGFEIEEI